jgi:hypothetical protein
MPHESMNPGTVSEAIQDLRDVLETAPSLLRALTEADAVKPHRPGGWSRKEILGHLIDSAANNHHRFVRGQLELALEMPAYAQEGWVAAQKYGSRSWSDLAAF